MIAGASISFWISFHAVVLAVLFADSFLLQRQSRPLTQVTTRTSTRTSTRVTTRSSFLWTAVLVLLALAFAGFLYVNRGQQTALEFISGYTIELSLSVDNLFVFLLLFSSFGLQAAEQRRALAWGVAGAIVMRGLFITAGVALLQRFQAVEFIFGAILLFAAIRLLLQKNGHPAQPAWTRWLMRENKLGISPFLLAVLAIEVTDLIFALDSVPAVIAVSRQTFVIYTSNICAILGLRSLYFVLEGLLGRLRLLHYGLGLILAFVGIKMLLVRVFEIPVAISLGIILVIVAIFTALSLLTTAKTRHVSE